MGRFSKALPSPSMAVAVTALFVALGGTGYAATQIPGKANANAAAKKKKKKKVANDNGPDTKLFNKLFAKSDDLTKDLAGLNAFLAATSVPNAKHATSADSATNAGSATNATNATHATTADTATNLSGMIRWRTTVATAGASSAAPNKVVLATAGPFTITGHCYINGSTTDAATFISTSQDGSATQGYLNQGKVPQNVSDGDVQISEDTASGTTASHTESFDGPDDGSFAAESPNGSLTLNGFPSQGVWMQGASGPACSFSGYLVVE